jgi:hypothetical protein
VSRRRQLGVEEDRRRRVSDVDRHHGGEGSIVAIYGEEHHPVVRHDVDRIAHDLQRPEESFLGVLGVVGAIRGGRGRWEENRGGKDEEAGDRGSAGKAGMGTHDGSFRVTDTR